MTSNYAELSLKAAEAIAEQLSVKPASCFGLPSGRSPQGCYELLTEWTRQGKLDWSQATCFALDEYIEVSVEHSFAHYFEENLYRHINLRPDRRLNPCMTDNYDQLIASHGGLDLIVIGIGRNGHVAFNEPGTPVESWTHCTWLTESTIEANASLFGSQELVPKTAVTMGLQTILHSRAIILLASGVQKKDILAKALSHTPCIEVPASCLQGHPKVTVLTDFPA